MDSAYDDSGSGPQVLKDLSAAQQVRLTEILDAYLVQLENHEQPSREELLAANPELSFALAMYLEKLDELYGVTGRQLGSPAPLAGQQLGDYVLEEEIGRGGMGLVFSAQDRQLNRRVALKLLPMAALLDEKHIERFKNEARAAANLQHPNIVPVYAIGEQGGIHFFAMRLIDGPSLDRRIGEHQAAGTLPPTDAVLRKFVDVAEALHAAHEYGIVHRDIKPSNLLLDSNHQLWIADFGLARCQTDAGLTRTGEMVGTMRYMSPEQASGRGELVDHRTDIYSLGATLFELLTLRPVIEGDDGPSLLRKIESQPPPRLKKIRSECSTDLQTVLDKAMSRRKDDRYANALDFATDLRNLVEGKPIAARRVSLAVHAARWATQNAGGLAIACTILMIAAIGLVTHNLLFSQQFNRAQANLQKARSSVEDLAMTADDLALLPGGEHIRRKVLLSTLSYYQDFAEQSQGDSESLSDVAQAHSRMGSIQEELGELGIAVEQYRIAESIYAQLLEDHPGESRFAVLRNRNLNHLGMALSTTGNGLSAIETLQQAVDQQRTESKSESTQPTNLGLSLNNYGLALQRGNRKVAAGRVYAEAIELLETAWQASPDNEEVVRGLAAALQNQGALLAETDPTQALEQLQRALELQLSLASQPAGRLKISRDLISTYLHLGNAELALNKFGAAKSYFQSASVIAKQLVGISPDVASYRRDYAISLSNLGMSWYQHGNPRAALEALESSEAQYRILMQKHADNTELRCSLGIALNNRAIVLQDLGKQHDAEDVYKAAATILEATQSESPTQSNLRALEKVYVNHGRLLFSVGREAEAEKLVQLRTELVGPPIKIYQKSTN